MLERAVLPPVIDVVIIDFMFLLRTEASFLPARYGDVARYLLQKTRAYGASTIFLVCDIYGTASIKDSCREQRGSVTGGSYTEKLGPAQSRPRDFAKKLKCDSFKKVFFTFLVDEWRNCAKELLDCTFTFAQETCYTYMVSGKNLYGAKAEETIVY